jgi:hypothetical protein
MPVSLDLHRFEPLSVHHTVLAALNSAALTPHAVISNYFVIWYSAPPVIRHHVLQAHPIVDDPNRANGDPELEVRRQQRL